MRMCPSCSFICSYSTEFDLEADEYVPLPKGDVYKKKEIVQVRLVVWGEV